MTDIANKNGGLYYFKYGLENKHQSGPINYFVEFIFVSNNKDEIMSWHLRLDHPSLKYL